MRVAAIVQARMGSTRLPGKVMADIAGVPMLARVIDRVRLARTVDTVAIATTTSPADDVLAAFAEAMPVPVFRGDEQDVLDRYHRAAGWCQADLVVRVTADCPLIDPDLIDRVVDALADANPRAAFAANTIHRSFPRGLDVEAMWTSDLARLAERARTASEREHVFPYAYAHPEAFPHISIVDAVDHSWMRWTVDTLDDLMFVRRVAGGLALGQTSWRDTLALLEQHADWLLLNQHVEQKPSHAS